MYNSMKQFHFSFSKAAGARGAVGVAISLFVLVLPAQTAYAAPEGYPFLLGAAKGPDNHAAPLMTYTFGAKPGTVPLDGTVHNCPVAETFAQFETRPDSEHPDGTAYIWVYDDAQNVYFVADWTSDNTCDDGDDYFTVHIDDGAGVKAYTQYSDGGPYGQALFDFTATIDYRHMYYIISVPKAGLAANTLKVGFELYGTASVYGSISWQGAAPATAVQNQQAAFTADYNFVYCVYDFAARVFLVEYTDDGMLNDFLSDAAYYSPLENLFGSESKYVSSHVYKIKPGTEIDLSDYGLTVLTTKDIKIEENNYKSSGSFTLNYAFADAATHKVAVIPYIQEEGDATGNWATHDEVCIRYNIAPVIATVTVSSASGNTDFAGGDGSQSNPYQIATAQQLANLNLYLGDEYDNTCFKIVADIDLADYITANGWTPVGAATPFYGNLDGAGHTVSGLSMSEGVGINIELADFVQGDVSQGACYGAGLFGCLKNASVTGLILDGADIDVTVDWGNHTLFAGALAAMVDGGELRDITVTGSEISYSRINYSGLTNYAVGGIAGFLYEVRPASGLAVHDVSVSVTIDIYSGLYFAAAGGVAGAGYRSVVVNAAATETAVAVVNQANGYSSSSPLKIYAGGITGYTSAAEKIYVYMCLHNSYSDVDVSIENHGNYAILVAGGLAGYLEDSAINNYCAALSGGGVTMINDGTNTDEHRGALFGLVHNPSVYTITRNYYRTGDGSPTGATTGTGAEPAATAITDAASLLTGLNAGREDVAAGVQAQYGMALALDKVYEWTINADVNNGWPVHATNAPAPTPFVAVTGITGVPATATAGAPLPLTGTVAPANATNKTIAWSIANAGTTGATVTGSTLNAPAAGTVTVTATIANGQTASTPYTQDFNITVAAAPPSFVAVTDITGVPATATAGTPLPLTGTVAPASATNKTIAWSIANAGTTGATVTGSTLNAPAAGTVTVTATIANGQTASTPYTQDFTITVGRATVTAALLDYNLASVIYDGHSHPVTVTPKSGVTGLGTMTVTYNGNASPPMEPGTYTVAVIFDEGAAYAAAAIELGVLTVIMQPDPVIPRKVTLALPDGILSQPAPGEHYVNSGTNFTFTLTLPPGVRPTVRTNRLIDGLTEELASTPDASGSYTFVVRQIRQETVITVTSTVGNDDIPLSNVWSSGGKIYISSASTGTASIYNVAGVRVTTLAHVSGETVSIALPKGLYFVMMEGRSYKVTTGF
jgi:hypothetical protein